jgi:hypothetical protein
MSFLAEQTKAIDVGGGNVVTIRKITFGTRQRILAKHTKLDARTQDMSIDHAMMRFDQLRLNIVSWTGPDFDGFGVTDENIERLPVEIADQLLNAIDEFNTLSDEEKKV